MEIIVSPFNIIGGPIEQLVFPFMYDYEKFDINNLGALILDDDTEVVDDKE